MSKAVGNFALRCFTWRAHIILGPTLPTAFVSPTNFLKVTYHATSGNLKLMTTPDDDLKACPRIEAEGKQVAAKRAAKFAAFL